MKKGKMFFKCSVALLLVFCVLAPVPAFAQLQIFVKVDGIPGESTDGRHKDWIDAFGYGFGVNNSGSIGIGGGASRGNADLAPVTIVKQIDKASPKLYETCAVGNHIKGVTIEFIEGGVKALEVLLTEVIITSVQAVTPEPTAMPAAASASISVLQLQEKVSFDYARIQWTYYLATGGTVKGCWDLKSLKKCS
jgi:type VI secretion system secreted protein Hcp